MNKLTRIISAAILGFVALSVFASFRGRLFPIEQVDVVVIAALLMMAFASLFIEHFFTAPTDVIASAVSILIMIAPIRTSMDRLGAWYTVIVLYSAGLVVLSVLALLLLDEKQAPEALRNRISAILKTWLVRIGAGKIQYFVVFLITAISYYSVREPLFLILFAYAAFILVVDPKRLFLITVKVAREKRSAIGQIIGVQSKNTFIVKLLPRHEALHLLDGVEFRYSMEPSREAFRGLIVDNYLLNQEQWIKVMVGPEITEVYKTVPQGNTLQQDLVYKLTSSNSDQISRAFVGLTVDGTKIHKLRFQYATKKVPIQEGDLLELTIRASKVLYQVVEGLTEVEQLEKMNETGYVVGEAIQLGTWNGKNRNFQMFGWVPEVNTPVFLAAGIKPVRCELGDYLAGNLPGTNYPVFLNKQDAISHHTAVVGITGCGKSVFVRKLVRDLVADEIKVVCVDFTNEYKAKLSSLKPELVVPGDSQNEIFGAIDAIADEMDKFANQRDKPRIVRNQAKIDKYFREYIAGFLKDKKRQVAILDLPDVSNTSSILDYTRWFFSILFRIAREKQCFGCRVAVVLEEAHTVVPEWNFLGVQEKRAQGALNSIAQIALQGRKYNIGLIAIAQRTANVSKTILTQCNTIIAFQAYDNTTREFLSNYLPEEMLDAMRNLRFRQAIAVGKACKSSTPVIFEVPEIAE